MTKYLHVVISRKSSMAEGRMSAKALRQKRDELALEIARRSGRTEQRDHNAECSSEKGFSSPLLCPVLSALDRCTQLDTRMPPHVLPHSLSVREKGEGQNLDVLCFFVLPKHQTLLMRPCVGVASTVWAINQPMGYKPTKECEKKRTDIYFSSSLSLQIKEARDWC